MTSKLTKTLLIVFTWLFCGKSQPIYAQNSQTDGDSTSVKLKGEIILDEILIEGEVEKPNVAILPTRVVYDYDSLELLERSFKRELLSGPPLLMFFDFEQEVARKIKELKKMLDKPKKINVKSQTQ